MRSRYTVVLAVGAALLATAAAARPALAQAGDEPGPSGGPAAHSSSAAPGRTSMMASETGEPGIPASPEMARMHQQMTKDDPGLAAAHQAMMGKSPQMARMHEQMMGASSSSPR